MLPNIPYGAKITTGWEPLIPFGCKRGKMLSQSQVVGGLLYVYVKPCLGNVECQGNKADNGTGSVLSISLVGLGVFFQGSTSSALLPVLCLLSLHWLPPFILFLILFPFCLHVPLAFQLFFWNVLSRSCPTVFLEK